MDLTTLKNTPPWDWPNETPQALLGVLRNRDADERSRLLAAEMAGDYAVVNDDLAEALVSLAEDPEASEDLRARAAISLGPVLEGGDLYGFEPPGEVPIREVTFQRLQDGLRRLYADGSVAKTVRRSVLEASVRAPQAWHQAAIGAAYADGDRDWQLTAVFAMRWVRGFNDEIVAALNSRDEEIRYEAVFAAGAWAVDAAWSPIVALLTSRNSDKALLLAAIEAAASIRPREAGTVLADLTDSDDEDVVDAAHEAMAMAEAEWMAGVEEDDEEPEL